MRNHLPELKANTPVRSGALRSSARLSVVNFYNTGDSRAYLEWHFARNRKRPILPQGLMFEYGNDLRPYNFPIAARPVLAPIFDKNVERWATRFGSFIGVELERTTRRLAKKRAAGKLRVT